MPDFNEFPEVIADADDQYERQMESLERSWEKLEIDAVTRAFLRRWAEWEEGGKDV